MDNHTWNHFWGNILRFGAAQMTTPNTGANSQTPEAFHNDDGEPATPGDSENSSENAPEKSTAPYISDYHSDDETDSASDSSEPVNDATPNDILSTREGTVARGFMRFSRIAYECVASKLNVAVSQIRDSAVTAVQLFKEKGFVGVAKKISEWVRENPWKTALIVVPLVSMAVAAICLASAGFGPAGIAAGSTAAIIQSGIGNVVAGSLFSACTSAMMGGYGAPVIFGGIWALTTAAIKALEVVWTQWNNHQDRHLIPMPREPSTDLSKSIDKAIDNAMFGSILIVSYVTYWVKSWVQARRNQKRD